MRYLHRQAKRRKNPRINVPEALAVVVAAGELLLRRTPTADLEAPRVAKYARGEDYHRVTLARLDELARVPARARRAGGAHLRRRRPGSRAGAGPARRPRLDRQEHDAHPARRRARSSSSARSSPICRCPADPPFDDRPLRQLYPLSRGLPHRARSSSPTCWTRPAASPISPSSSGARSPTELAERLRRVGVRLRHLQRRLSLEPALRRATTAVPELRPRRPLAGMDAALLRRDGRRGVPPALRRHAVRAARTRRHAAERARRARLTAPARRRVA